MSPEGEIDRHIPYCEQNSSPPPIRRWRLFISRRASVENKERNACVFFI